MAKKHVFSGPVDLNKYELLNARLQHLFEFPVDPVEGQIIYKSDLEVGALYNGATWLFFGLPTNILSALLLANSPSEDNAFLTQDDLPIVPEDLIDLFDTPNAYTGHGGKVLAVKITEDGIEFKVLVGVPAGGLEDQVLAKLSNTDFDVGWVTVSGGGGADANAVHYNADDAKTGSEKLQARDNLGLMDGFFTSISLGSNQSNWNIGDTNFLKLTTGYRGVQGIVATGRQDGEFLLIQMESGTLTLAHESASATAANRIQTPTGTSYATVANELLILRYNGTLSRWQFLHPFVRLNGKQTISGIKTFLNQVFMDAVGGLDISAPASRFRGVSNRWSWGVFDTTISLTTLSCAGNGSLFIRGAGLPNSGIMTNDGLYYNSINDWLQHGRSQNSEFNRRPLSSIRRDEQLLLYPVTVKTSGTINDLVQSSGIFNYYLTACTLLTGMADGEDGKDRVIQNLNSVDMVISHEDAGSIAANRYDIIGGSSLTVPAGGITTWTYLASISRWRLKSKNF